MKKASLLILKGSFETQKMLFVKFIDSLFENT